MKTIGLIGGMSWESSSEYYRLINQEIKQRLGGFHSASLVMVSVNLAEVEPLQRNGEWNKAASIMLAAARRLERAGAECIVICSNTMYKTAPIIEKAISIPLLHIADATAEAIKSARIKTVGLLGTRYTMEHEFYRDRLVSRHGLHVIVPEKPDRDLVHTVIYDELCLGKVLDRSKQEYVRIMRDLAKQGTEAIILGCTEISLLIKQSDFELPLFDTTALHVKRAVDFALQD